MRHTGIILLIMIFIGAGEVSAAEKRGMTSTDTDLAEGSAAEGDVLPDDDGDEGATDAESGKEASSVDETDEPTTETAAQASVDKTVTVEANAEEDAEPTDLEKAASDPSQQTLTGALKDTPGFKVEATVAGLWMYRDAYLKPTNEFRVNRARLKFSWSGWNLIRAVVKIEAKELFKGEGLSSLLRDAYVRVQPIPEIGLRIGQFKKPFSRIALSPMGRFRFVRRGVGDRYLSQHLLYGGRDIGAMLEGRLVKSIKLDYAVGLFNGMGMNTKEIGLDGTKDVVARIEMEPVSWLELGGGGSLKFIEKTDLPGFMNRSVFDEIDEDAYPYGYHDDDFIEEYDWMSGMSWMSEADAAVKFGGFRGLIEGRFGENWWFERYPYVWSTAIMASYKIKLKKGLPVWLEPVLKGEVMTFMDDGMETWRTRLWQITPGLNLHIGRYTRLMIDGEFVISQGTEADIDGSRRDGLWPNEYPGTWGDAKSVLVQLCFSI